MAPRRVVERLDIIEDGKLCESATGRNRLIELCVAFQAAPERFHRRVVETVSGAAHTAFDSSRGQGFDVIIVDVLAAAIGVMQEALGRSATFQGVVEGRQDQTGVKGRPAGPADDSTAPEIEDGRQVQPSFRCFDECNIGQPDLIGSSRSWTHGDEIWGDGLSVATIRCAGLTPVLFAALQAVFPHQTGAAAFTRARSFLAQVLENAWCPVGAPAGLVRRHDLRGDGRVLALSGARPFLAPAVIAAVGHAQQVTQHSDRVLALHRLDLGIPLSGVSEQRS